MPSTRIFVRLLLTTLSCAVGPPLIAVRIYAASALSPTTVALATSLNSSNYGEAVTLTATVSPVAAAGKITFYDGTALLGTETLASGQAMLTTTLLVSGVRSLSAHYTGSSTYAPGTSPELPFAVYTLPANGFQQPLAYPIPLESIAAHSAGANRIGDFNGDGIADLAVIGANITAAGTWGNVTVVVFLGKGDGTFGPPVTTDLGAQAGNEANNFAIGDFNGDGVADLVLQINQDTGLTGVALGNGDGTFQPPLASKLSLNRSMAVGDFNGDGNADLVVALGANAEVYLGNGDGTFRAPSLYSVYSVPVNYYVLSEFVGVGDFNGDGAADLVVLSTSGDNLLANVNVSVLLGNGDGTFQSPLISPAGTDYSVVPNQGILYSDIGGMEMSDFNRDGRTDLALLWDGYGIGTKGSVGVLLGNGDGTFGAPQFYSSAGFGSSSLGVGDFDGDGNPDLIVADGGLNSVPGDVSVLLGNGDGTFRTTVAYPYPAPVIPTFLLVGEFNGDGRTDFALFAENLSSASGFGIQLGKPQTRAPLLSASSSVVNGASFLDGIASGTWTAILGSFLSLTARTWTQSDFVGGNLPTSLDGVKVMINGKPAYVFYVSPTQVNVLAPKDLTTGPVTVQVTNAIGAGNVVTAVKQSVAPAWFAYSQQDSRYAVAQDGLSYALIGPKGLLGSATPTRPASQGEVVVLYATGLGDTSPPYLDGQIIQTPLPLLSLPQVFMGGVAATVQYAGIVEAGVYQINVVVPHIQSGDALLVIDVGGTQSSGAVFIPIQ